MIVFLNDKFMPLNEAKIDFFDRGFIFGDGIYEVLPIINSKLVEVENFWTRFVNSTKAIDLNLTYTKDKYVEIFNTLIEKNGIKEGVAYTQITRGVAKREFDYTDDLKPTIMAYVASKEIINHPLANSGIRAVLLEDLRWKRRDIKSISLLAQVLVKHKAHQMGAFEGIMFEDGFITEGSSSSVFMIKNDTLITRELSSSILPGIRREIILNIAKEIGLKVELRKIGVKEIYEADEIFISAASLILLPVINIDNKDINGAKIGKYSKIIRDKFIDHLKKESI